MRKRVILAFMLIFALAVTSSCGLIVKDPEVDKQTVIIEVAGKTFTKGEVVDEVNMSLDYQEYIYSMYGLSFDKTSADVISSARDNVINGLIQQAVLEQKEAEFGMDTFTEEELAELQAEVDETYSGYVDTVTQNYFAETELTGDELDTAVAEMMAALGYSDKETLLKSQKSSKAYDKLKADVVKDVQVSDDEILAQYNEKVESAKTAYESNLPSYGTSVRNGTVVYYAPAGYRYVKNILRQLSDEDTTAISDLTSQISDKQTQLSTVDSSMSDLNEDPTQDSEDEAQSRKDLEATKATLEAEIADLQKTLDDTREAAYAKVQPTIDEILQKLSEGDSFDALMEEYGEDGGMKASPAKEQGYLVCEGDTTWVTEFTEAAMALEKVGDVSLAVRTQYGIHLLEYASDLPEGEVPLEDVKDTITKDILTTKQDELFDSTVDQWVKDANARTYPDRLD